MEDSQMKKEVSFRELAEKHASRMFEFFERPIDASFIKKLREKLGMTQSYFAKVLGVSRDSILGWESGRNKPSKPTQILIYIINKDPQILKYIFFDSDFSITYKGEWKR